MNSWSGQRLPHPPRRLPVAGDFLAVSPRTPAQSMMGHADLGPLWELKLFGQRVVLVNSAELAAELCDESRFAKALPSAIAALRPFVGGDTFPEGQRPRLALLGTGVAVG